MKSVVKIFCILLLSGACFAAGAITAAIQRWLQPFIQLTIRNDSGQDLESLAIKYKSDGRSSIMTLSPLKQGESTEVVLFIPGGKGSYQIAAGFPGGQTIKGGAGYVWSGYETTEVIGKSGIQPAGEGNSGSPRI